MRCDTWTKGPTYNNVLVWFCVSLSDVCYQTFISCVKPGFPETIKTNDPGVLKAARHSVERFNNYTNDIFLFKESHISKALVQVMVWVLASSVSRTLLRGQATQGPVLPGALLSSALAI